MLHVIDFILPFGIYIKKGTKLSRIGENEVETTSVNLISRIRFYPIKLKVE